MNLIRTQTHHRKQSAVHDAKNQTVVLDTSSHNDGPTDFDKTFWAKITTKSNDNSTPSTPVNQNVDPQFRQSFSQVQHDDMGASFGGGFFPSKTQPKVPLVKPYGTTVLDLIEQGAFANKAELSQRPKSIDWIIKKYGSLKEKYALVRCIDNTIKDAYFYHKLIYGDMPSPTNALGYALKPASKGIIALSNTYDDLKTQYPIIGTIEGGAKIMFDGTLYVISAFAMPRITGTITAASIVFPEATGEIMAVGEYLYKEGLLSLNSNLTQREVDALGSASKFAVDTAFLKYAYRPALQNAVKGVNATSKFFNPSKVTLYDPMSGSGIIIDIGEGANSLKPFQPKPIFQEPTPIKPLGGNMKLIEYKAPILEKSQASTDLSEPVSTISLDLLGN